MDVNPMDAIDAEDPPAPHDAAHAAVSRLNSRVAVTVALLATFMAICKVKDDNIVQAMQQAQADKIDHWAYYQARNLREEVAQATLDQLELSRAASAEPARAGFDAAIARYQALVDDQKVKKEQEKAAAEEQQGLYDALNRHDDQFDLSDALLAIAISLLAITALTHKRWMYGVAMVPTVFGVLMGLAGLLGWGLHPDRLMGLLN
jgi:hypothetical protein